MEKRQISESETTEEKVEEDRWGVSNDQEDYKKWKDMTSEEKVRSVIITIVKLVVVLGCLYLFICSLSVMGSAFQILAGKTAGVIFGQESLLANPIAGLIIGVLVTVLVQSSSTSTSIVTTMVGADIITVHNAIPIIMGANIGTSVTNTIVSLMQSMDVDQFRRAFAGATVHDIFNLLSVLILLPLEVITGYLEKLTGAMIDGLFQQYTADIDPPDILKVITNPLTKKIVQVNKNVIKEVAQGKVVADDVSILKQDCVSVKKVANAIDLNTMATTAWPQNATDYVVVAAGNATIYPTLVSWNSTEVITKAVSNEEKICMRKGVFAYSPISDQAIGIILLILSLFVLCVCLITMVKVLHSLLRGGVSRIIKKVINTDFPKPFGWLTGYLAILVGAALTFVVQSSSVFTSTITPLVGMGIISLKRMYPLTLGSNIGTTTTAILAALAASSSKLHDTLQIALCHFFFNISGIIIWYPIPFMRHIPIRGAKFLGNTTAKYRWFAVMYLLFVFFLIPAAIFGLSLIQPIWVMGGILIVIGIIVVTITVIKIIQAKRPSILPKVLRNWKFLPLFMRSLAPYDKVIMYLFGWCRCCKKQDNEEKNIVEEANNDGKISFDNSAYANGHELTTV